MFLRNWYKIFGTFASSSELSAVNVSGTSTKLTYTTANTSSMSGLLIGSMLSSTSTATSPYIQNTGVVFGNGTEAPNFDDYWLHGSKVTTFKFTASVVSNEDENGITAIATYTITNTASADITISELGLVAYNTSSYFLVERTVLDSPVTIPAGGVGQITYTIRMNYPT